MKIKKNTRTVVKYELTKEESDILLKAANIIKNIGYSLEENDEDFFEEIRNDEEEGEIEFDSFIELARFILGIKHYDGYEIIRYESEED